jgi:hypothetical protein
MKVAAIVLAMGLVALMGCGGGESSEAQTGGEQTGQSARHKSTAAVPGDTPTVHHTLGHRAEKQKQKKQTSHKPEEDSNTSSSGVSSITAEEFAQFSGTDKGNWEIAYGICAVTPEGQLAKEFHTEQNWAAIGHAYGKDYREPFNIAAEEGCMAALVDSSTEREAAFKMMEG